MLAFVERRDVRELVAPVFIVAFAISLIVEHFERGLLALGFPCLAIEIACLGLLAWQQRWMLAISSAALAIVTAIGLS